IKKQAKVSRREIPFSILFTDVNSTIITRNLRNLMEQFDDASIDVFDCFLNSYEAYKSIQSFGGIISALDPKEVSSIGKAEKNAKFFTAMTINKIKGREQVAATSEKRRTVNG
ncbi:MAG: ParA family protein, partial [Gammaproteobacteria bacterium]|nr:ParA family protein [Gammaproteobacteria bacterium]